MTLGWVHTQEWAHILSWGLVTLAYSGVGSYSVVGACDSRVGSYSEVGSYSVVGACDSSILRSGLIFCRGGL